MSKQEMYAWTSLVTSAAMLGYYILMVWGLPEDFEGFAASLKSIFFRVILFAVVVEVALELAGYTKAGHVEKDERDMLIEAKGYRNAYYFIMVAAVAILGNVLVSDIIRESTGRSVFTAVPFMTFHVLLIVVFLTSMIKSATRLYYYQRGLAYGSE